MPLPDKNQPIINRLESLRKNELNAKNMANGGKKIYAHALPNVKKDDVILGAKPEVQDIEVSKEAGSIDGKEYEARLKPYEIAELKKMFPKQFGGVVDLAEARIRAKDLYWKMKHNEREAKTLKELSLQKNKLKMLKDIGDIKE